MSGAPEARVGPGIDPGDSALRQYPPGSDVEVIAALRHFLRESGRRPEQLDERAGLSPGSVALLASGYVEPSGPVLRRLCHELRVPRWLFHLTGALVVGAEAGIRDLEDLIEKRRRQLAGNPDEITATDLAVEAVEVVLALGEDQRDEVTQSASRRGLTEGVKRLARRAGRLGEPGSAVLLEAVAAIVLRGVEALSATDLATVADVFDLARSLEGSTIMAGKRSRLPIVEVDEGKRSGKS